MEEPMVDLMYFFSPGQCPDCFGLLVVMDTEITIMELNSNGDPITENVIIKCIGKCTKCGKKINMIRWKGGYIPYTNASIIFLKNDLIERVKERKMLQQQTRNPLVNEQG